MGAGDLEEVEAEEEVIWNPLDNIRVSACD